MNSGKPCSAQVCWQWLLLLVSRSGLGLLFRSFSSPRSAILYGSSNVIFNTSDLGLATLTLIPTHMSIIQNSSNLFLLIHTRPNCARNVSSWTEEQAGCIGYQYYNCGSSSILICWNPKHPSTRTSQKDLSFFIHDLCSSSHRGTWVKDIRSTVGKVCTDPSRMNMRFPSLPW